jgi:hypothetical protein
VGDVAELVIELRNRAAATVSVAAALRASQIVRLPNSDALSTRFAMAPLQVRAGVGSLPCRAGFSGSWDTVPGGIPCTHACLGADVHA